jgi:hypothetical protein
MVIRGSRQTVVRAVLMIASLTAMARQVSASPITEIQGSTQGCFGTGCGAFVDVATDATYGLTFTGVGSFDAFTDLSGSATDMNLGTFSRDNDNVPDSTPPLDFSLAVTFTLPAGTAGNPSTLLAIITAKNPGGGGPLDIDFDNTWQLLTFSNGSGAGSFEFALLNDPKGNNNGDYDIFGAVRNLTFESNSEEITPAAIPEPATLILLGTGLAGTIRRRWRQSKTR